MNDIVTPLTQLVDSMVTTEELRQVILTGEIPYSDQLETIHKKLIDFHCRMWHHHIHFITTFCSTQINNTQQRNNYLLYLIEHLNNLANEVNIIFQNEGSCELPRNCAGLLQIYSRYHHIIEQICEETEGLYQDDMLQDLVNSMWIVDTLGFDLPSLTLNSVKTSLMKPYKLVQRI